MALLDEANKKLAQIRAEEEAHYGTSSKTEIESTELKAALQAIEKRFDKVSSDFNFHMFG